MTSLTSAPHGLFLRLYSSSCCVVSTVQGCVKLRRPDSTEKGCDQTAGYENGPSAAESFRFILTSRNAPLLQTNIYPRDLLTSLKIHLRSALIIPKTPKCRQLAECKYSKHVTHTASIIISLLTEPCPTVHTKLGHIIGCHLSSLSSSPSDIPPSRTLRRPRRAETRAPIFLPQREG